MLLVILFSSASARSAQVTLCWDAPTASSLITGYSLQYGTAPGNYTNSVFVGNTTTYTLANLAGGTYYFVVSAVDSSGNVSGYSNEVSASFAVPSTYLSHYRYYPPLGGQANCGVCHVQKGTFLGGFGVRTTVGLCHSCHGPAGVGHERPYGGRGSHPLFVNVTADATHKRPSLGFVNGTSSDKTYTHLFKGKKVVCMTCHNSKLKPNDPGRSWEFTTTSDYRTYWLQRGSWAYNAYLKPVVYRSTSLWNGPTFLRDTKQYIVSPTEYDTDMQNGAIVFHQQQPSTAYVYVSLVDNYLRNTNVNNRLCLDCHITVAHKQLDCTTCHGLHNTDNLYNIRQAITTPQGTFTTVVFKTMTTMGRRSGICVVCHTKTKYYNVTSTSPISHYNNRNCTDCHKHSLGFPTIST